MWFKEHKLGFPLTPIPIEVYERGPADICAYFKSLSSLATVQPVESKNASPSPEVSSTHTSYRCKVCVVGPSTWGKTSFIKSFTNGQATLEEADTRTVGIDLFSWSFDTAAETDSPQRYNVTLWDFAGQDEYQSAHSLFFSRSTNALQAPTSNNSDDDDDPETRMNRATNKRLFSALWTLEIDPHKLTKTMTLRMRILSDLSGVCYHEPLCITVGDATVAKYGGYIQTGLSIFSCVVPDFLGKGVVDMIAGASAGVMTVAFD
ncbi:hypothetical protein ATCC90586_003151 [Pythium insidiosum]|nr:hypothetical protein ATCC90586_003151 [Pythium insidiosum]